MTTHDHMSRLDDVLASDARVLRIKESTYRGSWKKRGGVGAAMMILRKVDRLENICERGGYDIFSLIARDPGGGDGTALAEVRDLRRYLALVEAEMVARGAVVPEGRSLPPTPSSLGIPQPGSPGDGGHHAIMEDRLDDGMSEPPDHPFITVMAVDGLPRYNVDRRQFVIGDVDHLPVLDRELNHKEWEETPPHYQPMYAWSSAAEKWVLDTQYWDHWARQ